VGQAIVPQWPVFFRLRDKRGRREMIRLHTKVEIEPLQPTEVCVMNHEFPNRAQAVLA
jgi:hypothetical protein